MQKQTLTLLVGSLLLLAAGALMVSQWLADDGTPIGRWNTADEVEVQDDPAVMEASVATAPDNAERTAVALGTDPAAAEERVEVVLRGRVVDKFTVPIPGASVWLDFSRGGLNGRGGPGGGPGGRQRRVPDPVRTDDQGRFAFQGQTFRNLRISLQVAHDRFALGLFDKELGTVTTAMDLGDLVLHAGGEVRGRVTDLDGNGIAGAELRLSPENGNTLRFGRDRDRMLPPFVTDTNGFYVRPHLTAGDWSVAATAKRHTEGRSATFAVEEDQVTDVDDIRLGPGYELAGIVRNQRGEPIAKAEIVVQGMGRATNGDPATGGDNGDNGGRGGRGGRGGPGGGPGGFFGGGREHRTTTDVQGRFFLEHLPGVPLRLQADADGYLDYKQENLDATLGQQVFVTMQDGLRIEGIVRDGEHTPVTTFAFRAVWLRGVPPPGMASLDLNAVMTQLRGGSLDEATRTQLMQQAESLRGQFDRGNGGRRGPEAANGRDGNDGARPGGGFGGAARDLGKPEQHAGGTFVATGLQEGVYEVHVQSPDHARYRSSEIELRSGMAPPHLDVTLDSGVFVAGVVRDADGRGVRGARVEMRAPSAFEGLGRRGRGQQNPSNGNPGQAGPGGNQDWGGMAREFMRMASGSQVTLEATTDAEGEFVIKHAPRGNYRLSAEARGHADAQTDAFDLQADRSDFELRLGALGTITGTVVGVRAEEVAEVRVGAVPWSNGGIGGRGLMMGRGGRGGGGGGQGPFASTNLRADGTYVFDSLAPGEYLVRAWVGSTQDIMRELMPRLGDGTLQADAAVRAGETTKLDLQLTRPQIGTVTGSVLHNGKPASSFQVELTRQDEAATNGTTGNNPMANFGPGGRGGRGGPGGFGRTFQSAVSASGRFTIGNVPAGSYKLRIQGNRRGGTLHETLVQVVADSTIDVPIALVTHALAGVLTRDDGGNVAELAGRALLLAGVQTLPENLQQYQQQNPVLEGRVQAGKFKFENVPPGNYLLVINIRGRDRATLPVVVVGDQSVTLAVGKPATTPPDAGNNPTPRANPRQNR